MNRTRPEAIVIGGSAGGLEALLTILPLLRDDFPLPIAIVLHVHPVRPSHLVDVLKARCSLVVKEVEDKEPIEPGTIYVAPPNYHVLNERRRCFSLSVDEPVHFSRPAIDVLFTSAADAYGAALIGVVLSGSSDDGASGLACIKEKGGMVLVQAPATAVHQSMPNAAIRETSLEHALSLKEIADFLERAADRSQEAT